MNKSSFFIVGQHAVIEALKNPKRKVLRVFLTEESKKNIHRKSPNKNLLNEVKVYFKTKKELDKYSTKENLLHQGYVAEIEHLEKPILKEFIKKTANTDNARPFKVADNIKMMVIDAKTGKKANSKTKQAIIESFKTLDNKSDSLYEDIDSRLNSINILKFY